MRVSLKDDPVAVLEKMLDLFDSNDTKSHSKSMVNFQHAICRPCRTAQLDMIVKLESFQQDFGRLAKLLNITVRTAKKKYSCQHRSTFRSSFRA